jgi:hypothetical protein
MTLPTVAALKLTGFLMAHAFWITSELAEGELYVPQAFCEARDGSRELFVFEAETQLEAVNKGKIFLTEKATQFERCAFARDGQANPGDGYVDVLIIDIVEGNMPSKLTIIQPYTAPARGNLQLLGDELLLTESGELSPEFVGQTIKSIRGGADSHSGASEVWASLNASRTATNPLR